jgi:hypothetical protein
MLRNISNISLAVLAVFIIGLVSFVGLASAAQFSESWQDHVWRSHPHAEHTFTLGENVTEIEVIAYWGWTGQPGQNQSNEEHIVRFAGEEIQCEDMGNEELDGQWIECGSVTIDGRSELLVEMDFTGNTQTPGSHDGKIVVKWTVEEPQTPTPTPTLTPSPTATITPTLVITDPAPTPTLTPTIEITSTPSMTKTGIVTVEATPVPDHPMQLQVVKSRGSQLAKQITNEGNPQSEADFNGKFGELMSPMTTTVDSRALEVPHWLVDPALSFVERTIWTAYPAGDAEGKKDKGIEGKGFNIILDHGYIIPTTQGMGDYNLYLRTDEQAAAGSIIAAVEKKADNESYGPVYKPVPGNQSHRELHNPLGDAFNYEISLANAITEHDDDGMVQLENFAAYGMYKVGVLNGVFAQDAEQGLAWNGCGTSNPMACGRYNGTMDQRQAKATYWPTYQNEIPTYPSVPLYGFTYKGQVISYYGFYGISGIEFSFGDPMNPETMWWNADGTLRISEADYYNWLDHAFQTYYIIDGRIEHHSNKVIALEIETARLLVKYGIDYKFLAFVPANLTDEVGEYTPAFDWANFYNKNPKALTEQTRFDNE